MSLGGRPRSTSGLQLRDVDRVGGRHERDRFVPAIEDDRTSLATVLAVPELTYGANWIYTNTFRIVEVWTVVAPMYLITGFVLLSGLRLLESHFAILRR